MLRPDYWLKGDWIEHLWFLIVLTVYVSIAFGVLKIYPRVAAVLQRQKVSFPVFICLMTVVNYAVTRVGDRVPSMNWAEQSWFVINKADAFDYVTHFAAGYFLFRQQGLLNALINNRLGNALCVVLFWLGATMIPHSLLRDRFINILAGAYCLCLSGLLFWLVQNYSQGKTRPRNPSLTRPIRSIWCIGRLWRSFIGC